MNTSEVPRQMREARKEVLCALAASSQMEADDHRRRAAGLLNDAVHDIQEHPTRKYDWSLLRPGHGRASPSP